MPTAQALRLCPGLLLVPGSHKLYGEVSGLVMARLQEVAPSMEQISIDEAFLEISGLPDPPDQLAHRVQKRIRDDLGLPSSIGIASNKLVSKIATEVGKKAARGSGPPYALTIVPAGQESAFLDPLPAEMLWGVGPKTAAKLSAMGIHTIGDIAKWPEAGLVDMFGESGRDLAARARGQDDRPIQTQHETKSISQETTFSQDLRDDIALERTVRALASEVAGYLRKSDFAAATVRLKIRWPDFTTLTRQSTLPRRTDEEEVIAGIAIKLMRGLRRPGQAVRLIGVGVSGLGPPVRQLELWDNKTERSRRLIDAIDHLRERYGEEVIRQGDRL
jgi:DNA polymerase-4